MLWVRILLVRFVLDQLEETEYNFEMLSIHEK